MNHDFDTVIDRRAHASTKWNRYRGRDVIPMWVADMDFRSAPCIVDALADCVQHGIFGYTDPPDDLNAIVAAAMLRDFHWAIDPDWIVWLPSLVSGLNVAARAVAAPGERIVTAIPVYPPFLSAPENGGRVAVKVPLREEGGRWRWDFDALERAITAGARALLLCSPHNPCGRAWSREELERLAALAEAHDLLVVADEIHAGLVLDTDKSHVPFASLGPAVAARTLTLQSASKVFNTPGLGCAYAVVSDAGLRGRVRRAMAGIVAHPGQLGLFATRAAYRDGQDWRLALLEYLRGNRARVAAAIGAMPGLRTWPVEATYLAWIDARGLGVADPKAFFEAAGVGLHDGALFGSPGYLRMNFGCPRSVLDRALSRVAAAITAMAAR
jgi:cystathionine beta-lyase